MSSLGYGYEKTFLAVLALATGTGSLKDRLIDAFESQLNRIFKPVNEIPEEFKEEILALEADATARKARTPSEGSIRSTIDQMSEKEAKQLAERVLKLFTGIAHAYHLQKARL